MPNSPEIGTVVKADLVEKVYDKVGFTRKEAAQAVEVVFEEIKNALVRGEDVRIVGFASFNLRDKKARKARNPSTGEPIVIQPRRVLSFKPSKQLLQSTNRESDESKTP
ncbi:Integration host factor, alpha subunit [Nitrospina gracilis 3/211]|uniref:Integration host factor subunit alpha n=1 Tax=Nitrospina gracilis (strain 3/211) TaxID=1266370 RepID=M1Z3A3_NITG3|nr:MULTISPECIES: integration host factor subunit alpha [Nitrospina]MCF8724710.1 integration host factor subunit alpha [Nitrospina sp. Nb-3]CCQ91982.1 Integration host factor, alpha subunit [Nitrospina gracilis 3/211]